MASPGFCRTCLDTLVEFDSGCIRCAEPNAIGFCIRCRRRKPPFSSITAPYLYGGQLAEAIKKLKFQKQAHLARSLAAVVREAFTQASKGFDVAVPVPLHSLRMATRGFNQSQELLRHLAKGPPFPTASLLRRRGWQTAQSKLRGAKRFENPQNAFRTPRLLRRAAVGKRVLLVDDVVSTTATMRAAASALLVAGATEVAGFCVARVEA